ncbi:dihydroxyacetone kinase subunit DhaK [Flavimobilis marinus]|uniref:phosphoenolpyruvate--glycerone phosphotransferase n=1 Tax=Flavimobilis marinus TaxID=285351 RepID=A0A1I2E2C0_9MICO|nr:dihydroxyacetone kinase subunit DhaK [Flavimobilis marinus]GHG43803.1 dihydroxyacetone kinase subunit DhaK [Flavimobilis marinus]SFE86718.1 dihydroxyacetone kinase DhaK subunit [Flavimobilis marinus]
MKKLLNAVDDAVRESLVGFGAAHEELVRVHLDPMYVTRAQPLLRGTVAVVSGGGSGHEPLHTGLVGEGMLAAAVPGEMFTSPTPDQIAAAYQAADAGGGVLAIVKNYTGDVLNFETAAELTDGLDVEQVLVNDDVAVEDSLFTAGRRGVAGTLLVEKVAGAAAERGDDLAAVAEVARRAAGAVRSMGVALRAPVVPHTGRASFDLTDEEVEIGIGIHGEPGRHREPFTGADAITAALLDAVTDDLRLASGESVLLFVNGMGATPLSELYVVYGRARTMLAERGVQVARSLVGSYVTSLDMQGASITVMRLDEELTSLWDAPVHTAALRW